NGSDAVIGTAVVNAQGTYSVTLTTPQNNGGTLTVAQTDPAGNGSNPITLAAPDITPPSAPTATVTPNGTAVTGTGEPGATV
ncbi:Ig-like domain-containing protein, partial [Escherichia coli]|uniref:Ig-like domain-containing protein n=1 Tax=Escherichia coli TaxID=562 RepID=UPI0019331B87